MKNKKGTVCPIAKASLLIGDIWILLIIRDLLKKSSRFVELQRSLTSQKNHHNINSRTLTKKLKDLEKEKIITRKVYKHQKPPKVEYKLTNKGRALSKIIEQIRIFGSRFL